MKISKKIIPKMSFSMLPFVRKPYVLFFTITQRCNLHCSYCFGKYYSETGELIFPQIKKLLIEFYNLGVRRLGISGGEPLLHKDIDKVIRFAVELGYNVGINSNGILVPNHLKVLRLVNNLSISLDGVTEETHDKYRGKGSFKKAVAGIEIAAKAGIPLHFCCTLTDSNLKEWPKILDFAKKYNARVQISPLYPQIRGDGGLKLAKSWEKKIRQVLIDIIQMKKNGADNIFYSEETYHLLNSWPDSENDILSTKVTGHPNCLAGKKVIVLDSHGNLFACTRLTEITSGQNCLKVGVKNAYNNLPKPPCKSCRWACFIEYNLLVNLKLSAIINYLLGCFKRVVVI